MRRSVENLQEALGLRWMAGHWYSPLGVGDLDAGEGSDTGGGGGDRYNQRGWGSDRCRLGSAYRCSRSIPVALRVQDV